MSDTAAFAAVEAIRGVRVSDPIAGVTYEVTASEGRITSLTLIPHDDVDFATSRPPLPIKALLRLAAEANLSTAPQLPDDEEYRPRTPGPREVARYALRVAAEGGSPREQIALDYQVTVWTADKWIRLARDMGYLPLGQGGRPRKSTASRGSK